MTRLHNFSAGPAALPEAVLRTAQQEILDWRGKGLSVMEMSHRSAEFVSIAAQAERDLRDLMQIPDSYKVLFMQGGATAQFAAVPLNLIGQNDKADYLDTGSWSKKAIAEGQRFADVQVVASSKDANYSTVPPREQWRLRDDAVYFHYCANETIGGVELSEPPEVPGALVSDMSSTLLSRPIDISRFALVYAGAQKNIGPAGLVVVIVHESLLGKARAGTPAFLDYQLQADADSMYNTPPTYSWYLAGLVFQWLKEQGGLDAMGAINQRKAQTLYQAIDISNFYSSPVAIPYRSLMNIPFTLADDALDGRFLEEAEKAGLLNLKGHRSVGGMRASIYNAVSQESVDALVSFMSDFESRHG